ncbi:MAG: UDP-3-O-(3-hydroxymyristoyl)glucosamine N-acyltransferase [Planctomyces sp.]|nr:UDP-3-O-(3-hydroxymyristoyl)glucosamine N-acyltransferase [Planctomyces sp.]
MEYSLKWATPLELRQDDLAHPKSTVNLSGKHRMHAAKTSKVLTSGEIAALLDATIMGDPAIEIRGVETIERAKADQLAYVGDIRNLPRATSSEARVVIASVGCADEIAKYINRTFLLVSEPEPAFLTVAGLFAPRRDRSRVGISPKAVIHSSAVIGQNTNIHPLAVIGEDVVIGHNCEIGAGVVIGDGCRLGDHVTIYPNTVLYHDILIGNKVTIHAACVIGADGFGYRLVNGGHEHLPHYGTVRICDDVEIGAATTIDRAKVGETVIGTGTRIDNQVMIGHNCQIGRHNLLVSQVGFAGSVTTGDYVVCAGQVGIADHVHLGTGAIIGAKAGVHRDMPGGQAYLGAPAAPAAETTRQMMALRRLPELRTTVKQLEKELEELRALVSRTAAIEDRDDSEKRAA